MRDQRETDIQRRSLHAESAIREQDGHAEGGMRIARETVPIRVQPDETEREQVLQEPAPVSASWPLGSAVRIVFGLIWLVDVYFKWQPSFLHGLLDVMHDGTKGQPGWLMPWFNFDRAVIAIQPTAWAYGIAVVETGIALALLLGFARKITYLGGAVWSLVIWATAEGLGRTQPGMIATDIGTAIVYTVVFLALLAADQCSRTRPYSFDAVLERRLPWWRRIAEVGR